MEHVGSVQEARAKSLTISLDYYSFEHQGFVPVEDVVVWYGEKKLKANAKRLIFVLLKSGLFEEVE